MNGDNNEKQKILEEIKTFEIENEHMLSNITRLKSGNKRLRLEFAVLLEKLEKLSKEQERNNIDELPTLKNLTKDLNIATDNVLEYILDNVSKPSEQKKQEFLDSFIQQQTEALNNINAEKNNINIKDKLKQIVLEAALLNSKSKPNSSNRTRGPGSRGGRKRKIANDLADKKDGISDEEGKTKKLKKRKQSLTKIVPENESESLNENPINNEIVKNPFDLFCFKNKDNNLTEDELKNEWEKLDTEVKKNYEEEFTSIVDANHINVHENTVQSENELDEPSDEENNEQSVLNEEEVEDEEAGEAEEDDDNEKVNDKLDSESVIFKNDNATSDIHEDSNASDAEEEELEEVEDEEEDNDNDDDEEDNDDEKEIEKTEQSDVERSDSASEEDISIEKDDAKINSSHTENSDSQIYDDSNIDLSQNE